MMQCVLRCEVDPIIQTRIGSTSLKNRVHFTFDCDDAFFTGCQTLPNLPVDSIVNPRAPAGHPCMRVEYFYHHRSVPLDK